jgi:HipA-like protein
MKNDNVRSIDVYVESRRSRVRAGKLERDVGTDGKQGFRFTYDNAYLKKPDAVSVGPELPLTGRTYFSERLFPSFADRIPSRANPAYPEYCAATGISETESDPFVLLTTIGKRGPSCFVFEPVQGDRFGPEDASEFRAGLGLSLREFGRLFDFSPFTIQKIESGRQTGRDVLKRMELYARFPEAAWFEMNRNRAKLHTNQWRKLQKLYLGERLTGKKKISRD